MSISTSSSGSLEETLKLIVWTLNPTAVVLIKERSVNATLGASSSGDIL